MGNFTSGTPPPVMYSALDDARSLHRAVTGLGTNEKVIIAIIGTRTRDELRQIQMEYEREFHINCRHDIKDDCSGSFGDALISLMSSIVEVKTDYLYKSMQGVATKDKALIDVMAFSTNSEIEAIKQIYREKYGKELADVLQDETSGNFRKTLLKLVQARRLSEFEPINGERAQHDATQLYDSGEKRFGTDDDFFIDLITRSSQQHLAVVSEYYKENYQKTLIEAIQKETSGDYRDLLKALATPKIQWYAERLHTAVRGLGTHDTRLVYMLTSVDKAERLQISAYYHEKNKESLEDALKGDISGDYLSLMLTIITP